ncbi:immunoglobulin-like domain-containing protein [Flavihumibacter petaseus]|uniref:Pesticidal crystal protein Cry22Aa Ig-like domain-containing protein n=1 Tax=Flavihumibacter petaseus NBRC 106054 TaxID=1220578 RepID=A0A0E9N0M2_9BACT|nr:immunoglobulin-like domain-containing protein [Flavihumibacter petaseus]GAO42900.1 hypothetical protein FPE01S_02_00050 [Flavihumibacter petaseus NBRC 106054]
MMKPKLVLIALTIASLFVTSCEKDDTAHVSKEVLVSYPGIALNGDELIILPVGGTYTEEGAVLTDDITGETSALAPSSSDVNTAEPGLYIVLYTASNANGFETQVSRKVAVTDVTNTVNRAGDYLRPATGIDMTIEKEAEGVYKITNPGGAGIGTETVIYMVETAPNVYVAPEQPTDVGTMALSNIEFGEAGGVTWIVLNVNYGPGPRAFTKL